MKKESKKHEYRNVPVLIRESDTPLWDENALSYLISEMLTERVEIDDSFQPSCSSPYEDQMEVVSTLASWEDKELVFGFHAGEKRRIPHFKVLLRYVPAYSNGFKYSAKKRKPFESDRYIIDEHGVSVQYDIAKHPDTLLFPFVYYLMQNQSPKKLADSRFAYLMESYGLMIDSVEIDAVSAAEHPEFLKWFESVGRSLYDTYEDNPSRGLEEIAQGKVYVVYGDFDPNTRTNRLAPNKPEEDQTDEDDD